MKRLGPVLLRPGAEEGVTGSVHWRLMPRGGKDDVRLIAVNADETSAATVTLPLKKVKPAKVVFGDGRLRRRQRHRHEWRPFADSSPDGHAGHGRIDGSRDTSRP
jgi:hypothetical protein